MVKCMRTCYVSSAMSNSLRPYGLACQALLSKEFSWQEYWSGLLCPPPGDLPNPGIEPESLKSLALTGRFFTTSSTWKAHYAEGNMVNYSQYIS